MISQTYGKIGSMIKDTVTIKAKQSGATLATAVKGAGVHLFEGAWYFDKDKVDMTDLVVTDRIYTCPYKGRCYWIDLQTSDGRLQDVAWIYFELKPGYEFVEDQIGFYAGSRAATEQA
jgi:uncharacterized protein (DUF427 family)